MVFYTNYKNNMDSKFSFQNSSLGAPTNPTHAKQLEEFGRRLNSGVRNIEIGTLSPEKFEFIPKEHFDTIRQLATMTDTRASFHGPLMDLAGFDERNGKWTESDRKGTVEQVWSMIDRAQAMTVKKENGKPKDIIPVVFHAGATFSQEFAKGLKQENPQTGKEEPYEAGLLRMRIVNSVTGEVTDVNHEKKFNIIDGKEHIWTPHKRLSNLNETQWDEEKGRIFGFQKEIDEINQRIQLKQKQNEAIAATGLQNDEQYAKTVERNLRDIHLLNNHVGNIEQHLDSSMNETFSKFTKAMETTHDEKFKKRAEEFKKEQERIKEEFKFDEIKQRAEDLNKKIAPLQKQFQSATSEEQRQEIKKRLEPFQKESEDIENDQRRAHVSIITAMPAPDIWRPVAEFAKEKTADTIAEVMLRSYDKHKDASPFIAIENFWPNTPMSTSKELKDAVIKARKVFEEKLVKERKLDQKEAEKVAERLISATWDIGHIYNLRKAGYEGDDLKKMVIEQTKEIASVARHVHVTDNFGFHDSHLPPGMGHVPVKEMMSELQATWDKLRDEGKLAVEPRSIVEAGGFVAEIGGDPTVPILNFFNSPLYKLSPGQQLSAGGAYWKQPEFPGYRSIQQEFPQQHFNLYGSSFTTLPKELGGQITGEKSRFSDTPLS